MSTHTLPETLDKIVQKFKRRENPKQKYEQLLWYAKRLAPMPEEEKTPENKVAGCVSQVYVCAHLKDGKVYYHGDSDAQLVKGLVAFLIEGLNGLTPQQILSLTPSRANGFINIFKKMQQQASRLQSQTLQS